MHRIPRARDDLHVFVGGDFLGESYRTSKTFGTDRGQPTLNHALVDYEEIRVGPGASWNILPLLEMKSLKAGLYGLSLAFDYHEVGPVLTSHPAPFVSINFQALFEVGSHDENLLDTKSPQFQFPVLKALHS